MKMCVCVRTRPPILSCVCVCVCVYVCVELFLQKAYDDEAFSVLILFKEEFMTRGVFFRPDLILLNWTFLLSRKDFCFWWHLPVSSLGKTSEIRSRCWVGTGFVALRKSFGPGLMFDASRSNLSHTHRLKVPAAKHTFQTNVKHTIQRLEGLCSCWFSDHQPCILTNWIDSSRHRPCRVPCPRLPLNFTPLTRAPCESAVCRSCEVSEWRSASGSISGKRNECKSHLISSGSVQRPGAHTVRPSVIEKTSLCDEHS